MTRGLRNNNPLNIRFSEANHWKGKLLPNTDGEFEQFVSMDYGFLAALHLIENYILLFGCNTLNKILSRWAPPQDGNDTDHYIQQVCAYTGIGGNEPLSNFDPRLKNVLMAMAIVESGHDARYHKADIDAAWQNYRPSSPKRIRLTAAR